MRAAAGLLGMILAAAAAGPLAVSPLAAQVPVPVAQEPRHVPVFRDGPVAILDVRLLPSDTSMYHVHDAATLYVPIHPQPADAQVLGREWFGLTRTSPNRFAGVPFVLDTAYAATPLTHRVVNIGDGLYRLIVVVRQQPGQGSIERSDLGWQPLTTPGGWAYVAPRTWWRVTGDEVVVVEVR